MQLLMSYLKQKQFLLAIAEVNLIVYSLLS